MTFSAAPLPAGEALTSAGGLVAALSAAPLI
eukprot:CAMPEP_0114143258 /NCGR_PEP_ID=MMETSP0043_2-20121206/18888_1 /TAXON_ID=464988 /ORGANISM="Hemiselmis andersenii, Strain CCMP644" /LENGTH=30 /DNA_ID= /DNA_START= /DNA_END= /DNA_ORIENTATION=